MQTVTKPPTRSPVATAATRIGYLVGIAVNALLLFIANNLLEWEWLPWLTDEFDLVLGLINISLGASIGLNVVYLGYDRKPFKALGDLALALISLAVTVRMWRVFPFDFSAYEFDWPMLVRVVLVLSMVGLGIGIIAQTVRLGTISWKSTR